MSWVLPPESSQRWAGSRSPFALHGRRRWLGEAGPQFAVQVTRETADLEDKLYRVNALLQREPGTAGAVKAVAQAFDCLYAFHLIWRVSTPLVRATIEGVTTLVKRLEPDEREEIARAIEASRVLPFPGGAPERLLEVMLLYFEGLLPPKKPRAGIGKSLKSLSEKPGSLSPTVLAHRLQALSAHNGAAAQPIDLIRQLSASELSRPVLISLVNAASAFPQPEARAWCETRRDELGGYLPPDGAEWGDPYARDAFLIEQTARRLGWVVPVPEAAPRSPSSS